MKIIKQIAPFLILGLIFSGGDALAQSKKEKREKAKQLEKVVEYEVQKHKHQQELEELVKAKYLDEEKLKSIMEDQKIIQEEALKRYHITLGGYGLELGLDDIKKIEGPDFAYKVFQDGFPTLVTDYYGQSKESTSLTIQKRIEDLTFRTKFKYNVQEGSDNFHFIANGSVKEGSIMIKLVDPSSKVIHEFEVSPLADVNWSQNFKWDEENAKKNTGIWTIEVSAKSATGRYSVSVRAH